MVNKDFQKDKLKMKVITIWVSHHFKCKAVSMPKVGLLIFPFWTPHFVVWTPHFSWTPRWNYSVPDDGDVKRRRTSSTRGRKRRLYRRRRRRGQSEIADNTRGLGDRHMDHGHHWGASASTRFASSSSSSSSPECTQGGACGTCPLPHLAAR